MSFAPALALLAVSAYASPSAPAATVPPVRADAPTAGEFESLLSPPAPGFDLGDPAQIVNPADKQKPPPAEGDQVSTTTVTARRVSEYREEDRFGPYDQ